MTSEILRILKENIELSISLDSFLAGVSGIPTKQQTTFNHELQVYYICSIGNFVIIVKIAKFSTPNSYSKVASVVC